jgi:hypothetical protein
LIAGCSQYSFFVSGPSSDTAGLLFILVSLNILIRIVENPQQLKIARLLLYAFIFFLTSFFRYMYLPVSILFPVLIFAYGAFNKNKKLKKTGMWLCGFIGLFVFLMLFWSYQYGGTAMHVIDTGRGFFFDQLIHWYPYIPASFINLDFLAQLITKTTGVSYTNVFKFFEIVNVVLLFTLLFLFFRHISSFKKIQLNKSLVFIISGAVISLCILFLLTYFSLTYKPQLYGVYLWNYNYESRYFAFLFIFLPILFLLCIYIYPQLLKNMFSGIVIFFMLIILAAEVLHGVYYNVKIIGKHKDIELVRDRVADFRQFPTMIRDLKTKYPDREILVSASDQFFLYSASEMGYRAIFDYTNLNKKDLPVQKKCMLLFPIHETDVWIMKEYLERKKPQMLNKIAGTVFYLEEINP